MDYSIKSLGMLKMEKNFIAHIEKTYPRQPYREYSLSFLFTRLCQEATELKQAIATGDESLIREEIADCSNVLDYMFEKASQTDVERASNSPKPPEILPFLRDTPAFRERPKDQTHP